MSDYRLLQSIQVNGQTGPPLTMYRDFDSLAEIHEGDAISPGLTAKSVEYDFIALRHEITVDPSLSDDESGRQRAVEKMRSEGWQNMP